MRRFVYPGDDPPYQFVPLAGGGGQWRGVAEMGGKKPALRPFVSMDQTRHFHQTAGGENGIPAKIAVKIWGKKVEGRE